MADVNSTVQNAASGVVGVIKALIVLFVFVNIVYSTGCDPIGGIVDLVNTFLDGGFAGLLALLVFSRFWDNNTGYIRDLAVQWSRS